MQLPRVMLHTGPRVQRQNSDAVQSAVGVDGEPTQGAAGNDQRAVFCADDAEWVPDKKSRVSPTAWRHFYLGSAPYGHVLCEVLPRFKVNSVSRQTRVNCTLQRRVRALFSGAGGAARCHRQRESPVCSHVTEALWGQVVSDKEGGRQHTQGSTHSTHSGCIEQVRKWCQKAENGHQASAVQRK